ncbi:ATP-binding protein [Xylophilus sp.]|uniref:ATP-binding protein n=1 Tax=Xylophilus sp. TaxID=2653893 RepID=UPI0013B7D887|nr:ATP-binding protein [Xylophilus sp.]KAF1045003.1 MAG: Osmolarity sensor protein EnvZ [Xylophilus sp.]
MRDRLRARFHRLLPRTLFGRLALLLFVTAVVSHAGAIALMVELRPQGGPPGPSTSTLVLDIAVRLLAFLLAAWIGARWLARPVRRLAAQARALGRDIHRPPLPETGGTVESREAARVFNQMQARIRQQLAERDRFVAAVSHDLRTPLTRLRLRAETLEDERERAAFSRDIAEMDDMIRLTLDYLRGAADGEQPVPVDLAALAQTVADDRSCEGAAVQVQGHAAPLAVRPSALRRCIENLVGNALRYAGGAVEIHIADAPDAVRIAVTDRGPGLPPDELERVLEPFYRLEASRNRDSGGAGLGLSIASEIAARHGGRLLLRNRGGGGLEAIIELPRSI